LQFICECNAAAAACGRLDYINHPCNSRQTVVTAASSMSSINVRFWWHRDDSN